MPLEWLTKLALQLSYSRILCQRYILYFDCDPLAVSAGFPAFLAPGADWPFSTTFDPPISADLFERESRNSSAADLKYVEMQREGQPWTGSPSYYRRLTWHDLSVRWTFC